MAREVRNMQESSVKVTCDGCGQSRTFALGRDKRADFPPWYVIGLDVSFRSVGQGVRAPVDDESIDACSAECAAKVLAKRLPALPETLDPLK